MFEQPPTPTPTSDAWEAALADYRAGRVMRLPIRDNHGETVTMAVTQTWLRTWKQAPLSHMQRLCIHSACRQITAGVLHPALAKRRLVGEPLGCWQATPYDDIHVTWIGHWGDREVPVMLTLDYSPDAS